MDKLWIKIGQIDFQMLAKLQFDFETQQATLKKIAAIDAFQSRWKVEQVDEQAFLKQIKSEVMIESTGSSTRIEGSTLTNAEVESVLRNMKIIQLKTRDEQEVAGYYEVLTLILDEYPEIPLTENYIGQLHGLLLRHSAKDQGHRGVYKSLSNQVVANSPGGTQKVVFNTTPPHLTPGAMQEIVLWTNQAFVEDKLHQLLIIALFVYEFLSIHPFQDGNGRLSRLLTTLLLLKRGYDFVQYVSFEHIIEDRKKDYYRSLMDAQQKRGQSDEIINQWVLFFLDCLLQLTQNLDAKRKKYLELKGFINDRQKQILAIIAEHQPLQVSNLHGLLPQIPRSTLKYDLDVLVKQNLIIRVGKGRGVRYFIPGE